MDKNIFWEMLWMQGIHWLLKTINFLKIFWSPTLTNILYIMSSFCRCANNPLIGRPNKITTVDKFQGQQNDYILLSLVRTYNVGHLRDVRRLVVAMSRARLGLYIFARVSLFQNCFELQPAFNILTRRPLELHLSPNEVIYQKWYECLKTIKAKFCPQYW